MISLVYCNDVQRTMPALQYIGHQLYIGTYVMTGNITISDIGPNWAWHQVLQRSIWCTSHLRKPYVRFGTKLTCC